MNDRLICRTMSRRALLFCFGSMTLGRLLTESTCDACDVRWVMNDRLICRTLGRLLTESTCGCEQTKSDGTVTPIKRRAPSAASARAHASAGGVQGARAAGGSGGDMMYCGAMMMPLLDGRVSEEETYLEGTGGVHIPYAIRLLDCLGQVVSTFSSTYLLRLCPCAFSHGGVRRVYVWREWSTHI